MLEYEIEGPCRVLEVNRCLLGDLIEITEKEFLPGGLSTVFDFVEVRGCLRSGEKRLLLSWLPSLYIDDIYSLPIHPCITLAYLISEAKRISDNYKNAEITFSIEDDGKTRGVFFKRFYLKAGQNSIP